MLLSLHVKNLALIREEQVDFTDGLNILTGETGAGKSIIIGSVNLALGAKADKGLIRTGEEYALVELIFGLDNETQKRRLTEMDLPVPEDGTILVKRKIYPGRSQCTINGETVTLTQLRDISRLLIDVYGQRENGALLQKKAQLSLVDSFAGEQDEELRAKVRESCARYQDLKHRWETDDLDTAQRAREADLLAYEVKEIEEARLKKGEDDELEKEYRRLSNFRRISEAVSAAGSLGSEEEESAAGQIERALRDLNAVNGLDENLDSLAGQLSDIDSLLSEFGRSLSDYVDSLSFDPQHFQQTEERLNTINRLKDKYGPTIGAILEAGQKKQQRLEELENYDASRQKLKKDLQAEKERLLGLCGELSKLRREAASGLARLLTKELLDLNFNQVDFHVEFASGEENLSAAGYDDVTFYISMNPGEAPRPLDKVASGGELSRIMLGLKTVFAGKDDIHTFIFDEIDSGISGQTAWKVATKMGRLAGTHQILCITHLPQIAAMEDSHYLIRKTTDGQTTQTHIKRLEDGDSVRELGRMLGTSEVTDAVLENARELKRKAAAEKGRKLPAASDL